MRRCPLTDLWASTPFQNKILVEDRTVGTFKNIYLSLNKERANSAVPLRDSQSGAQSYFNHRCSYEPLSCESPSASLTQRPHPGTPAPQQTSTLFARENKYTPNCTCAHKSRPYPKPNNLAQLHLLREITLHDTRHTYTHKHLHTWVLS